MVNPVYLALDVPDIDQGKALLEQVKSYIGGVKLGMEFFYAHGLHGAMEIAKLGLPIFLDLKLHDIPNTVASALQSLHILEPSVLTIHAAGGRAMMEDAKAAVSPHTKVVAVTVLTSLDQHDLTDIGVNDDSAGQVTRLTELAKSAGIDGIVCSGHEVSTAKKIWHDGFFVVPGLRLPSGQQSDQKRVVTPRQARDSGASILVIGRPISRAEDPVKAAREILATI